MELGLHYQAEVQNILGKIAKFLSVQEAQEVTLQIYDRAIEVDEEITTILEDALVGKLYDYDGMFFTRRDKPGFHTAFDGLHILRSVGEHIDTFFRRRSRLSAIHWLLDELDKHVWIAKRRRMNWEEFSTLELVPAGVIEGIVNVARNLWPIEVTPLPLSAEERSFFTFFEQQLIEDRA